MFHDTFTYVPLCMGRSKVKAGIQILKRGIIQLNCIMYL